MRIDEIQKDFMKAFDKKDLNRLMRLYGEIKEFYLENKDLKSLCVSTTYLVESFSNQNRSDLVIRYGLQLINLVDFYPELTGYTEYYAIKGTVDFTVSDYEAAKESMEKEMALHRQEGNEIAVASCLSNISEVETLLGNLNEALNTLLDAQKIFLSDSEAKEIMVMYNKCALANVYLALSNLPRAKVYLDEIMSWEEIDNIDNIRYELYLNLGLYYAALKKYDMAITYYQEAEEIVVDKNQGHLLESLYDHISDSYFKMNDTENAYRYLKKTLDFMKTLNKKNKNILKQNYELEFMILNHERDLKVMRTEMVSGLTYDYKYDGLTPGYTLSYVENMLERQKGMINESEVDFAIMVIDLSVFSDFNKNCQMEQWEKWNKKVVTKLISMSISHQYVARMNSHKILVTFHSVAGDSGVKQARKMIDGLKEMAYKEHIELGLSAGYVQYKKAKAKSIEDLYRLADMSLYQSKHLGQESLTIW